MQERINTVISVAHCLCALRTRTTQDAGEQALRCRINSCQRPVGSDFVVATGAALPEDQRGWTHFHASDILGNVLAFDVQAPRHWGLAALVGMKGVRFIFLLIRQSEVPSAHWWH